MNAPGQWCSNFWTFRPDEWHWACLWTGSGFGHLHDPLLLPCMPRLPHFPPLHMLGLGTGSSAQGPGVPICPEIWRQRSGATTPLLPNFWTYEQPCRPDDIVLWARCGCGLEVLQVSLPPALQAPALINLVEIKGGLSLAKCIYINLKVNSPPTAKWELLTFQNINSCTCKYCTHLIAEQYISKPILGNIVGRNFLKINNANVLCSLSYSFFMLSTSICVNVPISMWTSYVTKCYKNNC